MLHDSCVLVPHPTAAVVRWCVDSVGSQSCRSRELSWARPFSWADSGSGRDNTTLRREEQKNGQICYISDASSWNKNVHMGTQCIQWLWPAKRINQLYLLLHILSIETFTYHLYLLQCINREVPDVSWLHLPPQPLQVLHWLITVLQLK